MSTPDPRSSQYLAFTPDTDPSAAAERFKEKYGEAPQYVFESGGLLLAGPVPND